jgi:hypothetical protein
VNRDSYPLVLRAATAADLARQAARDERARTFMATAVAQLRGSHPFAEVHVVDAEYQGDGGTLFVFFASPDDQMVRTADAAQSLYFHAKCRIWLRRVPGGTVFCDGVERACNLMFKPLIKICAS